MQRGPFPSLKRGTFYFLHPCVPSLPYLVCINVNPFSLYLKQPSLAQLPVVMASPIFALSNMAANSLRRPWNAELWLGLDLHSKFTLI